MYSKLMTMSGVAGENSIVIGGLFLTRKFDPLTNVLVCTDITDLHKAIPSLRRALDNAILQLDCVRQLPRGLELNFSQVEHLTSHAIGIVAVLERLNPFVDFDAFEELARRIGARTHQLLSNALLQRANSKTADQIPLEDGNVEEARRVLSAFDACINQAGDLASLDPLTNSSLVPIRIMPNGRVKSVGQSGPIVERICSIDRFDTTSAWATNVGNRNKFEIQFADGIEGYMLQLVKVSRRLVRVKLAPTSFSKHDKETKKFRLIEITGVESVPWGDIANIFGTAAESLARLPTPEEHCESESPIAKVANSESHTVASNSEQSDAVKHQQSTRRRNRRVQEPL